MSFNPLPSPKRGETFNIQTYEGTWTVSIRSPHRSEGRRCCRRYPSRSAWFQSAPLTEARGDILGVVDVGSLTGFQSAPLTEARGDLTENGEP